MMKKYFQHVPTSLHATTYHGHYDDGSCKNVSMYDASCTCINDYDNDGICDEDEIIGGWTDGSYTKACNYNPNATDIRLNEVQNRNMHAITC